MCVSFSIQISQWNKPSPDGDMTPQQTQHLISLIYQNTHG